MEDIKFDESAIEETFTFYKSGEVVESIVIHKRTDGAILSIGGKSDAFINSNEFDDFDAVKLGDKFKSIIISKRNAEGLIEVSKRKYDNLQIGKEFESVLKIGTIFEITLTSANKFGAYASLGNYSIFVPISQLSDKFINNSNEFVGKKIKVVATEIDIAKNKVVASARALIDQEKKVKFEHFASNFNEGDKVNAVVVKLLEFGAIVDINGVEALLHKNDMSYEREFDIKNIVSVNEELDVIVLKIDKEQKRVNVGLKQLSENPIKQKLSNHYVGEKVLGKVIKLLKFGVILELEDSLTGLLHASSMMLGAGKAVNEFAKFGESIEVYIKTIEDDGKLQFSCFEIA